MADEVSEEQLKQLAIDEKDDESSKYKAPAEKSIAELQQLDADDEALRRYKESLLGTHRCASYVKKNAVLILTNETVIYNLHYDWIFENV